MTRPHGSDGGVVRTSGAARSLQVTTPSDQEVRVTRVFDAPRAAVFRAFTEPALIRRWLLGPPGWSMPVCEVDLRVGGHYRYVWQGPDGEEMGMGGVFREIDPSERLVTTERFDQDWTGGETTVTTVLTERDGRTTLTLTVVYASEEARNGALKTGMAEGMGASYDRLDGVLAALG